MLALSLLTLLAVLAAAGWTLAARRAGPAYLLIALAVLWLFANGALEGPVLWTLDREHGLVLADLLSPVCVLLAGWRLLSLRRRGRADDPTGPAAGPGRTGPATDPSGIPVRSDRPH